MGGIKIDAGERFGKLVVVKMTHKVSRSGRRRSHWVCRCDCGNMHDVDSGNLRNGNTSKCPACALEQRGRTRRKPNRRHRIYSVYKSMKSRCLNKNDGSYDNYGGRGITICERWRQSFDLFVEDMGMPEDGMTLERIDVNGNYEPKNCCWADVYTQASNKRNNRIITAFGKTQTLAQWCRELNIDRDKVKARVDRYGIPVEQAFLHDRMDRPYRYETPDGEFATKQQVADHYGISTSGVHGRMESDTFPQWRKHKVEW